MIENEILIKGMYRDLLLGPDNRITFDSGWHSNTIVIGCRMLLAGFMKNETPKGIQYLAMGQGLQEWDNQWNTDNPPKVSESATQLESPFAPPVPVAKLKLTYLDESDKPVIGKVTSRLQVKATLKPGYPAPIPPLKTYPLREFGLFGQFDAEDYMINCVRHPVIHKDESATLIRTIRLYF